MNEISKGDKCTGCGTSLFDLEDTLHECQDCGAVFCNVCMEKIKAEQGGKCPSCSSAFGS
jgi:DNA-directed RNA polymerase subunit RPC12/RpoP